MKTSVLQNSFGIADTFRVRSRFDVLTDDELEIFEERAAIMEYDGGMSREQAETMAIRDILDSRQTLSLAG